MNYRVLVHDDSLAFGPHSESVVLMADRISSAPLLAFSGRLSPTHMRIRKLEEAIERRWHESRPGWNWLAVMEEAECYATSGSAFELVSPWKERRRNIQGLRNWVGRLVFQRLSNEWNIALDDADHDLTSVLECIIYRGELDPFHQMVWEVYEAGGFPCGWEGPLEQLEDGRLDVTDVRLYVLWMENDPPAPPTRQA